EEVGIDALRRSHDLDDRITLHDLFPQNAQLQLREAIADAAMDAEAEGQMLPRPCAIDDEVVRVLDRVWIAVARDVPHDDLVALFDGFAADLAIGRRGTAHMDDG